MRPAEKVRQNVTVHFSLALNQIIALDDTSGQLDSRVTLRMVSRSIRGKLRLIGALNPWEYVQDIHLN